MKYKYRVLFFILLYSLPASAQQLQVRPAFELKEFPAIVEGMTYDPIDSMFYFGESLQFKILRYTKSGRPAGSIDASKDGMTSLLGMSVSSANRHLWVCGAITVQQKKIMCLFQYNLRDGKLINRFPDTSGKARLFNDVAITGNGGVYITDTYTSTLYKVDVANKVSALYLRSDSLRDSNGITAHGNILYVSTSRGFARINTEDKSVAVTRLDDFMIAGNDGLYYYKHSLIGIQNVFFPVTIGRYRLDVEGNRITKAEVLAAGHPSFIIPTTGAVVNDEFYFMANNNIGNEDPWSSQKVKMDKMKKITVVKINLAKDSP